MPGSTISGTSAPIAGATINAVGLDGVALSGAAASSRADGTFTLCLPEGVEIAPQVQAAGYPTTYIENFKLTGPLTAFAGRDGIPMLSTSLLGAFAGLVSVGSVSTQAGILAGVTSTSRQAPCFQNSGGWVLALNLADGGVLPDGGGVPADLYYADSSDLPSMGLSATSSNGVALFFNVDTSLTNIVTLEATNADAGPCAINLVPEMMTGRLYVATGAMTIAVLPTP